MNRWKKTFFVCWYKFRKSKSWFNDLWVGVVKNGCLKSEFMNWAHFLNADIIALIFFSDWYPTLWLLNAGGLLQLYFLLKYSGNISQFQSIGKILTSCNWISLRTFSDVISENGKCCLTSIYSFIDRILRWFANFFSDISIGSFKLPVSVKRCLFSVLPIEYTAVSKYLHT